MIAAVIWMSVVLLMTIAPMIIGSIFKKEHHSEDRPIPPEEETSDLIAEDDFVENNPIPEKFIKHE